MPTIVEISTQLDKALKDMNDAKTELDKSQAAVAVASDKYQKSIDSVNSLRGQLDKTLNEALAPSMVNIGRVRVA